MNHQNGHLKRKRVESSSSSQSSSDFSPLDVLHRLCLSTTQEEFSSPKFSLERRRKLCPICKNSVGRVDRASFQCDFCPLIYHVDCLKCFRPSSNEFWMCPNHHSSLFDRISMKRKCERVQIRHQRPTNEPIRIRQDFHSSKTPIEISEIPSTIEKFYFENRSIEKLVDEIVEHVCQENESQLSFIDLCQFRYSHAALIHLESERVIYLRKRVIWFGSSSSSSIDIDLRRFPSSKLTNSSSSSSSCSAISERHACLYFDDKQNRFELLNYSEFGTIVDGLRYGFDENFHLDSTCICQKNSLKTWSGAASIDEGTRFQLGCHRFVFYRYVQR